MSRDVMRETTTFDFGDADVSNTTFEDIESDAEQLVTGGNSFHFVKWARIRHTPLRRPDGSVNWGMVGAIATVVALCLSVAEAAHVLP